MRRLAEKSWWNVRTEQQRELPELAALDHDLDVGTLVVGAGITGLTTAIVLVKKLGSAADRIAVIDSAADVGLGGTTGASTGHLDCVADVGLHDLVRIHGTRDARKIVTALADAVNTIGELAAEHHIECDFVRVPAFLFADAEDGGGMGIVEKEMQAARELGIDAKQLTGSDAVPFPVMPLVCRFDNAAARIDPLRYVQGLTRAALAAGIHVFPRTRLMDFPRTQTGRAVCEVQARVEANREERHRITARHVVLATHSSFGPCLAVETRSFPFMSCSIAARLERPLQEDSLLWDVHNPYRYTRVAGSGSDRDVIVVGGEDFKVGTLDPRTAIANLEEYVRRRFAVREIVARWTGELWSPFDLVPFVGSVPGAHNAVLLAAAFEGQGLTFGTAAAKLLASLIVGKEADADLERILSPGRLGSPRGVPELLSEGAGVAASFITGLVSDGEKVSSSLPATSAVSGGAGRLVRKHIFPRQARPLAVYREPGPEGAVHVRSATCTHRFCGVQWNAFDKTWDCPCHGGRYSEFGERIFGPPTADLKKKEW